MKCSRILLRHFSVLPLRCLVAVGADRQAEHRVDAEPAQWLGLPLAGDCG